MTNRMDRRRIGAVSLEVTRELGRLSLCGGLRFLWVACSRALGMNKVAPVDVAGRLAAARPSRTARSVTLDVAPNAVDDPTTLEQILHTVLVEVVTNWPDGTTWVVTPASGRGYLQGVSYPPSMLAEFGPGDRLGNDEWAWAIGHGWINPDDVPKGHTDFASRAIWGWNPVKEVSWSTDGIPDVVAQLADAADCVLDARRRSGMQVRIWARDDAFDGDRSTSKQAPVPADVSSISVDVETMELA